MRYLFIFFLLTLFSCVEHKRKTSTQNANNVPQIEREVEKKKKNEQEVKNLFYNNKGGLKTFDFNKLPLSKDIDDISNNDTDEYNVSEQLRKEILKEENYYKLVNYSEINNAKNYKAFTIFGNYDYYTNILLVTSKSDSLVDYEVIASIIGDADDMTEISTIFLDSTSFEVTTHKKRLTKSDEFKTLTVDSKRFKIRSNGKIDQM